jgi:hypothetical protein
MGHGDVVAATRCAGRGERGSEGARDWRAGSERAWGSGLGNRLEAGGVGGSRARAAVPRSRGGGV